MQTQPERELSDCGCHGALFHISQIWALRVKKQHKLVLVNPVNTCRSGFSVNSSSRFPPLGLGIIASLTPDAWDVELVDENFSPFNYRDADLVGITAFTSAANRAYQIAAAYQRHGIPVVMGGIHASMCFAEAQQFVDAVVIGEAESVWPQVLADVLHGKLKPTYRGHWLDLAGLQPPRRDIYDSHYMFASIQTSRGCPLDCDFCSVTAYNGRRYRRRPTNEVLDEIESIPHDLLFFVDDNVIGYGADSRQQAMQLFQGMVERDLRKRWICQASVNIADDAEVLDWAGRAGCRMVFLGLEAEDIDSLTEVNKRLNMKRGTSSYEQTFDRIHQAGIAVLGAFIFGMDGDTPDKLRDRTDFMLEQRRRRDAGHRHDTTAGHAIVSSFAAGRSVAVYELSRRLEPLRSGGTGASPKARRAGRTVGGHPRVCPADLRSTHAQGQGEANTVRHGQLGGDGIRLPRQRRLPQRGQSQRHHPLSPVATSSDRRRTVP